EGCSEAFGPARADVGALGGRVRQQHGAELVGGAAVADRQVGRLDVAVGRAPGDGGDAALAEDRQSLSGLGHGDELDGHADLGAARHLARELLGIALGARDLERAALREAQRLARFIGEPRELGDRALGQPRQRRRRTHLAREPGGPRRRLRRETEALEHGQALSINPYWYKADRDLARQIVSIQNENLAQACAANPDRFVAFATVALQHPDLAAEQLEEGVKKYGLRGAGIGGSVDGLEISDPKFHPFWAKAEQLDVVVFIHPQGTGAPAELQQRFKGNGYLGNVIGNPLETTIALSHLIFEGTLDKFPGLKICAAHAGGFLPSYS